MGDRGLYRAPYSWLMLLPGFDGLRVPARFCDDLAASAWWPRSRSTGCQDAHGRWSLRSLLPACRLDGWPRHFNVFPRSSLRPSPSGVTARLNPPHRGRVGAAGALPAECSNPCPYSRRFRGYGRSAITTRSRRHRRGRPGILQGTRRSRTGWRRHRPRRGCRWRVAAVRLSPRRARPSIDWNSIESYRVPRSRRPRLPERSVTPIPIKSLAASPQPGRRPLVLDGQLLHRLAARRWRTRQES